MGLIVKYTPAAAITGSDILNKRLQSLTLTDAPGYASDTLKIMVNMEGIPREQWPKSGTPLRVELGWLEAGLVNMGQFTIAKVKPLYLPKRAEIIATSAPFNAQAGEAKLRRSQTYQDSSLGDIIKSCAARLGLVPRVHPDFDAKQLAHIDQKNETDLSFLQRLAVKYDAVVKPVDGKLVFSRRGQTKSLSGQSVPAVELQLYQGEKAPHNALLAVSFVEPERDQFLGVRADFHDIAAAEIIRFETGQTPFKQLPGRFKDQGEAIEAAEGELKRMTRQGLKISFTVAGEPELMAEGLANLVGFDEDHLNGKYSNDRVTHIFTPGGTYKTRVEASVLL